MACISLPDNYNTERRFIEWFQRIHVPLTKTQLTTQSSGILPPRPLLIMGNIRPRAASSPSPVTIYTYHSLAVANVLSPEVQLRLTAGHPVFLSITTCRNYRYEKD